MTKKIETPQEILAEMKKVCSEAYNEDWILGGCSGRMITTPSGYTGDGFIADVDTVKNANFIAQSRTAMPRLIAALERSMAMSRGYCKRLEPLRCNMYLQEDEAEITAILSGEK